MNSDRFNFFAQVFAIQVGNDLTGVPDQEHEIMNCWGTLLPTRGTEYSAGQQMQSEATNRFVTWMTEPEISPHHYLMINDRRFDVLEQKNVMGQFTMQELTLKEIR